LIETDFDAPHSLLWMQTRRCRGAAAAHGDVLRPGWLRNRRVGFPDASALIDIARASSKPCLSLHGGWFVDSPLEGTGFEPSVPLLPFRDGGTKGGATYGATYKV
jgi:hypothetical protein